jgi:crotonobetainyl-CoA:carnitine CoA-transferase CaiB-like acyl-CoA transferase
MRIDPQGTPGVRSPIVMSDSPLTVERRSPRLGEHGPQILREIGLD